MNNFENILPYGSMLKTFIAHSTITDSDFRELLNKKGIFLNSYERKIVFPILETTLLLPKDYRLLIGKVKEKDERVKRLSKSFKIDKDINLKNVLNDFSFNYLENETNTNYQFTDCPTLTEENNSCIYEYRIKSFDKYESWGQRESEHTGSVIVNKKNNCLEIEVMTEYTSPNTKQINDDIVFALRKHFVSKKIMAEGTKAEYIKYADFKDNSERVKFLLSFRNIKNDCLTFDNVGEIKFAPDNNQNISDSELSWMENRVKKTILSGNEIDKISFFNDVKNHKVLTIEDLVLSFNFTIENLKGKLQLKIGFPDIINTLLPDKPFEFSITNIKFEDIKMNGNEKKIEKICSNEFHRQKDILFSAIKDQNQGDTN